MRFNLFYEGDLESANADVSELLHWLADLRFDLPDDVIVDISICKGEER